MARGLIAGMTDYSHQSLEDIVADLAAEARNARAFVQQIESNIEESRSAGYWDAKVSLDFRGCVIYALKHYNTVIIEVDEILADIGSEIQAHHCRRLRSIGDTADEINRSIGKVWNQNYPTKEYGNQSFAAVERVYADTRDMAVNLLDFSNIASRLEDFVGRKVSMRNNPWKSGSFYLFAVVVIVVVIAVIGSLLPWYVLPPVVIGGLLVFVAVGVHQLRNDGRLKEESYVKLMGEVFRSLPLVSKRGKKEEA